MVCAEEWTCQSVERKRCITEYYIRTLYSYEGNKDDDEASTKNENDYADRRYICLKKKAISQAKVSLVEGNAREQAQVERGVAPKRTKWAFSSFSSLQYIATDACLFCFVRRLTKKLVNVHIYIIYTYIHICYCYTPTISMSGKESMACTLLV